jgi:hypothetical protein
MTFDEFVAKKGAVLDPKEETLAGLYENIRYIADSWKTGDVDGTDAMVAITVELDRWKK